MMGIFFILFNSQIKTLHPKVLSSKERTLKSYEFKFVRSFSPLFQERGWGEVVKTL